MTTAYIALGSNQGDSIQVLADALKELAGLSSAPVQVSSFWKTEPVNCPPGSPPFINAVARLVPHSEETPETLLGKLQDLEKKHGRRPKQVLNEPRPLDLDLIAFGTETRDTPALILPHPRWHQRRFVLAPLAELDPDLALPGEQRTVQQLLDALAEYPLAIKLPEINTPGIQRSG